MVGGIPRTSVSIHPICVLLLTVTHMKSRCGRDIDRCFQLIEEVHILYPSHLGSAYSDVSQVGSDVLQPTHVADWGISVAIQHAASALGRCVKRDIEVAVKRNLSGLGVEGKISSRLPFEKLMLCLFSGSWLHRSDRQVKNCGRVDATYRRIGGAWLCRGRDGVRLSYRYG